MSKKLIPFKLMPGSWGLKGRAYEEAEAHYYLEGEELERKLLDIRYGDDPDEHKRRAIKLDLKYEKLNEYEATIALAKLDYIELDLQLALLDIDLQFEKIAPYDYDIERVKLLHPVDNLDRKLDLLEVDYRHGKLTKNAYEKQCATLKEEPWIGVIDHGFDPSQGLNGVYFEFDWNDYWIEYLRQNGYNGLSDEQIVEQWFSDVCRTQTASEDVDFDVVATNAPVPFPGRRVSRREGGDGTTGEYS